MDKQIAFSPKDISEMLNLPLSSITKYMREYNIKVLKNDVIKFLGTEHLLYFL